MNSLIKSQHSFADVKKVRSLSSQRPWCVVYYCYNINNTIEGHGWNLLSEVSSTFFPVAFQMALLSIINLVFVLIKLHKILNVKLHT